MKVLSVLLSTEAAGKLRLQETRVSELPDSDRQNLISGYSLVVQWLVLHASSAGSFHPIVGELRLYMPHSTAKKRKILISEAYCVNESESLGTVIRHSLPTQCL